MAVFQAGAIVLWRRQALSFFQNAQGYRHSPNDNNDKRVMKPSPILVIVGLPTVVLGVPLGLYALLTRGQRHTTREIRNLAAERGGVTRRGDGKGIRQLSGSMVTAGRDCP